MHKPGRNPAIVAWEITRQCGLTCKHCRGAARDCKYEDEFSTAECFKTIDSLAGFTKPMIILTGGEPLMRSDIFEVARYATDRECRVVLATCGHLLTEETAGKLKAAGVMAVSFSLDAATAEGHNRFRGLDGAYEKTIDAIETLKTVGIPFQVNTTGRGAEIADLALDPAARDQSLKWIASQSETAPIQVRVTCAPQYHNFIPKGVPSPPSRPFKGCMGGRGFVFISHTGVLQTCGFLDLPCGDLRTADFDFKALYEQSDVFQNMRTLNPFAGCPARAYASSGDYMKREAE